MTPNVGVGFIIKKQVSGALKWRAVVLTKVMPSVGFQIGIDGEAKFRASINNISAALKALDAQMKSTTSAFTAQTTAEEKNKKTLEQLAKQAATLITAQKKAKQNIEDATSATSENSSVTLKAKRQYEEVTARLNETYAAMQQLSEGFEDNGAAAEEATGPLERYADTMATLQAADKVLDVLHTIGDGMTAAAESSIEFESAFTGVKKTVDGTPEQLAAISDEIKRMAAETGVSTTTIAAVAETPGSSALPPRISQALRARCSTSARAPTSPPTRQPLR
mgnify:CR=1 FL=1